MVQVLKDLNSIDEKRIFIATDFKNWLANDEFYIGRKNASKNRYCKPATRSAIRTEVNKVLSFINDCPGNMSTDLEKHIISKCDNNPNDRIVKLFRDMVDAFCRVEFKPIYKRKVKTKPKRKCPSEDDVRNEAYLLSEQAGHPPGREKEFWHKAKKKLKGLDVS